MVVSNKYLIFATSETKILTFLYNFRITANSNIKSKIPGAKVQ